MANQCFWDWGISPPLSPPRWEGGWLLPALAITHF
jgi:hypothetical protein